MFPYKDPYISELSNGIRVGVKRSRDVKQVVLCFAIGAGTAYEDEKLNGVAHMVTHMNILGSSKRTGWDIGTEIEATGAEIQFFVHPEKTEYYLHLPLSALEKGIEVIADCLFNATFPLEALKREKTVIEQEIVERQDNQFVLAADLFSEASFTKQGYGFCPLGTTDSIQNLSVDDLKDYKKEFFHPKNMSIAAYGNIEIDYFCKCLNDHFGKFTADRRSSYPERVKPRFSAGYKYLCRPNRHELAHAFIGFPISDNMEEIASAYILSKILGSGTTSRLFQQLRQKRALGYTMAAKVESLGGMNFLKIYLSGWKKNSTSDLLEEACKLIRDFPSTITQQEVMAGINKVIHELDLSLDNPFVSSGMLAEQLLYGGDPNQLSKYVDALQIIPIDVVTLAASAIFARKPSVSFVGPYEPPSYEKITEFLQSTKDGVEVAA